MSVAGVDFRIMTTLRSTNSYARARELKIHILRIRPSIVALYVLTGLSRIESLPAAFGGFDMRPRPFVHGIVADNTYYPSNQWHSVHGARFHIRCLTYCRSPLYILSKLVSTNSSPTNFRKAMRCPIGTLAVGVGYPANELGIRLFRNQDCTDISAVCRVNGTPPTAAQHCRSPQCCAVAHRLSASDHSL
jgi:hypothetical protein